MLFFYNFYNLQFQIIKYPEGKNFYLRYIYIYEMRNEVSIEGKKIMEQLQIAIFFFFFF